MNENKPTILAQPTAEGEWEVRGGDWRLEAEGHVIGHIAELGGVYEVHGVTGEPASEYCATFKDAMEHFKEVR